METEQKLNIDYYIEMFKSDPKKDMKKGKILKKRRMQMVHIEYYSKRSGKK